MESLGKPPTSPARSSTSSAVMKVPGTLPPRQTDLSLSDSLEGLWCEAAAGGGGEAQIILSKTLSFERAGGSTEPSPSSRARPLRGRRVRRGCSEQDAASRRVLPPAASSPKYYSRFCGHFKALVLRCSRCTSAANPIAHGVWRSLFGWRNAPSSVAPNHQKKK